MDVGEYIRNKEKKKKENKKNNDYGRYMSMNEEQLMQELFKVAHSSNVSEAELDDFYRSAGPYLTPEQKEKMKRLIGQLKGEL